MKPISETQALCRLNKIKSDLKVEISNFESRGASCSTCKTPGVCCLDAHFVNVHISRLEAVAIRRVLDGLPDDERRRVEHRIATAISENGLTGEGDTFAQKYACPLFEKDIGCLVHSTAKPAPCIVHACYENEADLPPDALQSAAEDRIAALNTQVYGRPQACVSLPLAISRRGGCA